MRRSEEEEETREEEGGGGLPGEVGGDEDSGVDLLELTNVCAAVDEASEGGDGRRGWPVEHISFPLRKPRICEKY